MGLSPYARPPRRFVTVGTVFQDSTIALNRWMLATPLLTSSNKGMSAHLLHRIVGVAYKPAWFMTPRILKRGLNGVYHHVSEAHLSRYLAEFDFRYNNRSALGVDDIIRHSFMLAAIGGKRLTYRRIGEGRNA